MKIEIRGMDLSRVIGSVIPAACKDETRPHMNGIAIDLTKTSKCAVATDGHWLAVYKLDRDLVSSEGTGIGLVPFETAKFLESHFKKTEAIVTIDFGVRTVEMTNGFRYPLPESGYPFPPWRQVCPKKTHVTAMPQVALSLKYMDLARRCMDRADPPEKRTASKGVLLTFTGAMGPILVSRKGCPVSCLVMGCTMVDRNHECDLIGE